MRYGGARGVSSLDKNKNIMGHNNAQGQAPLRPASGRVASEAGENGSVCLQWFPRGNVPNEFPAKVETFSDGFCALEGITRAASTIKRDEIPFSDWAGLVKAKVQGVASKVQLDRLKRLKGRTSVYRCVRAPAGEVPMRGNAGAAWALVLDCDRGQVHPGFFGGRLLQRLGASVAMFGSASNLEQPGYFCARLIIVLDRFVSDEEYRALYRYVSSLPWAESAGLDPVSGEISRLWYAPTRHEDGPQIDEYEFEYPRALDVEAVLREARRAGETAPVPRVTKPRLALAGAALEVEAAVFVKAMEAAYDFEDRKDYITAGMSAKSFGAQHGDLDLLFEAWKRLSEKAWGGRPLQRSYADEWASFKVEVAHG